MLTPWWCGARKNMQLQPHTGCSWRMKSSTAGLRNGVLQLTRTSLPPPCSPCPQSKKPELSHLVEPCWRRMRMQHILVSHLTRRRSGSQGRGKDQILAGHHSTTCWYHLGSKSENTEKSTKEKSDPISSMAPKRGKPQQEQTNRPLTRFTTRHSDHWCDAVYADPQDREAHWSSRPAYPKILVSTPNSLCPYFQFFYHKQSKKYHRTNFLSFIL